MLGARYWQYVVIDRQYYHWAERGLTPRESVNTGTAFDDKADRHLSKLADLKLTFVFGIRFRVRPTSMSAYAGARE